MNSKLSKTFYPASLSILREYSFKMFFRDLVAGVVVAVVALPLAIAFGIASGANPVQGLTTAVIGGFLISMLSGSKVQIGGPTGAFIVIIYGIISQYGYAGLMVATIMAGVILVVLGICRMGSIIKFIPYPVVVGLTAGLALIIAIGQIREFFGFQMDKVPPDIAAKLIAYGQYIIHLPAQDVPKVLAATVVSGISVCICIYWKNVTQKIPGSLIAIVALTAIVQLFGIPVETIGDRFPAVAGGMTIPMPVFPRISPEAVRELISPAIAIAVLAGLESLLSMVVADGMTGQRSNSNTELIGQGVANIGSAIFGGIPCTGAFARTAANVKSSAASSVSGLVHAALLLLIMLFLGKWAAMIPLAVLAGIVVVVAYNMSEWRTFVGLFRSTSGDVLVLLLTFFLTILVDLTVAIQAGMLVAAGLFIKRMSEVSAAVNVTKLITDEASDAASENDPLSLSSRDVPPNVEVFEIQGALFFGAADKFRNIVPIDGHQKRILILRMRHVRVLDATALHSLREMLKDARKHSVTLLLSGVHSQPLIIMQKSGFFDELGQDNIFGHIDEALIRARELSGAVG